MAAVCVAIFCLGQKGTRKKNIFLRWLLIGMVLGK